MTRKQYYFILIFSFELAIILPLALAIIPNEKRVRHISVNAKKFQYSPSRIIVNKGDTIILKFSSSDVTHGFHLDGYAIDLMAKKGTSFRKMTDTHDSDSLKRDWIRVSSVKFTASRSGKHIFRCTKTCGNLHPFMTGEMIVRPNTAYHFAVSMSVWITFYVLLSGYYKKNHQTTPYCIDLFDKFPRFKKLVKLRNFQLFFVLLNLIVFYVFILSSLWGSPVGNRNIAIVFVWILWWFLLKAVMVPFGGRVWCFMCPLPVPAEWLSRKRIATVRYMPERYKKLHHRFFGLEWDWPKKLQNIWLQNILFLILISFGMILITRPVATALIFLLILCVTFFCTIFFRHRVFCRYLCPVGGFLGTYSMAAMTEIRSIDKDVCKKHRVKSCFSGSPGGWACPWNQYIGNMKRNTDCGLCTECIKSCPKDNIGIFLRPFGSDRLIKGYDEVYNVIIMLVVAIVFSAVMLGPWGVIKDAANVTESGNIKHFLIFVAVVWSLALVIFPAIFILLCKMSNYLAKNPIPDRTLIFKLTYILIPVGIFAWISFSLPAIMINYGYVISILSDPLGLGWNIFNLANVHFKPFLPQWIPLIQGIVLLTGLYLGLNRGLQSLQEIINKKSSLFLAMSLPSVFALICINILLKIIL
ncbi:4Fe-4S binding protein [Desulfobacterales bacterium HSG17]|nr:4Fe-4S binding protein [Desulfobacterales bacterium HSG17]